MSKTYRTRPLWVTLAKVPHETVIWHHRDCADIDLPAKGSLGLPCDVDSGQNARCTRHPANWALWRTYKGTDSCASCSPRGRWKRERRQVRRILDTSVVEFNGTGDPGEPLMPKHTPDDYWM